MVDGIVRLPEAIPQIDIGVDRGRPVGTADLRDDFDIPLPVAGGHGLGRGAEFAGRGFDSEFQGAHDRFVHEVYLGESANIAQTRFLGAIPEHASVPFRSEILKLPVYGGELHADVEALCHAVEHVEIHLLRGVIGWKLARVSILAVVFARGLVQAGNLAPHLALFQRPRARKRGTGRKDTEGDDKNGDHT